MAPRTCIFTGPMFASKTTNLLKCWQDIENIQKFAFKYSKDKRYECTSNYDTRQIMSHDNKVLPAVGITTCHEINSHIPTNIEKVAVFIDEGQFFKDIKQWVLCDAPQSVVQVYISGLDFDIFGNKFNPEFNDLMDIVDECHTLSAKCYVCGDSAYYTQFIDNNNSTTKLDGNVLIGGAEQYQPACSEHFVPFGPTQNNNN